MTGGAQIVFNDVETLTQKSPERRPSPTRVMTRRSKRSYEEAASSVGSRVAAFETKLGSSKKYRYNK